jgi:hypothetical protein
MSNNNNTVAQDSLYCPPVNNAGLRPTQGFHIKAFVLNACDGKLAWFGEFQSLTVSIRNSTESYLELGNRFPMHLDGEIQIAWVAEQGLVDGAVLYRTFGVRSLRRDSGLGAGPRFQISWVINARELEASSFKEFSTGNNIRTGELEGSTFNEYLAGSYKAGIASDSNLYSGKEYRPRLVGRYDLHLCKVDSMSLGMMAGRRVNAVRWEGVAEGITWVEDNAPPNGVTDTNNVFLSGTTPRDLTIPTSIFNGSGIFN